MSHVRLRLGYVPLTDAAPLIVARELGFAAEEGLDFDLVRLQSWAQSRDLLGMGGVDAAHMLVPLPIAQALGLGPAYPHFDLLMVLSLGGQAIVVGNSLADALRALGHDFDLDDPMSSRAVLCKAAGATTGGRLRVGVPFPFSTQAELVLRWLDGTELAAGVSIHTVPPPLMADALASGDVDAFCVGEPWASHAVERQAGTLLLAGRAIWSAPPEKGLVVTRNFAETRAEETGRLMRALWRACRWLDRPDNRSTAAEILSRPDYLDLPPELTERGLIGRLHVNAAGEVRQYPGFVRFHDGAANFPWRSLAALLARRIAGQHGLETRAAMTAAMQCFRTDLYRQHLREAGAALPGASVRLEGSLATDTIVPAENGQMILGADAFFDGETFDPDFAAR
jgi:NitT/TauT family transport system ATP-binding protein